MSRSSSGSWSGGGAAPPADIIDLDRFMRSARPSHPRIRSALVVDAGGPRSPQAASSSGTSSGVRPARPAARAKRHSHDSGLSDGSYGRRRQRPHRRVSCGETHRPKVEPHPASTSSLHAFRAVCERALLDQQQQIARVAQLCERLTERRPTAPTTDSSETSSSSRSTRDQRRKDKHRTEECKTYKIIMTKLDELNRLFAMRARSPQAQAQARARPATRAASRPASRSLARARAPDSASASVSVSDKLVATEGTSIRTNSVSPTLAEERARRLAELRAVAAGPALDIAPRPRRPNVLTESVVKCDASDGSGASVVAGDARFGFDLNDPVHLYAQAKRLHSLHAGSAHGRAGAGAGSPRGATLCALCRGYLRALRHYLAAQLCYPAEPCAS